MVGRNPTIHIEPGTKFGRLTYIEETRNNGRRAAVCECVCLDENDRLTRKIVNITALTSGAVTSCGCLRRELASTRAVERNKEAPPRLGTGGSRYLIDGNGRECAGHYCGNAYKSWNEFNVGNAANGHNSWCRDCTKAHYKSKAVQAI